MECLLHDRNHSEYHIGMMRHKNSKHKNNQTEMSDGWKDTRRVQPSRVNNKFVNLNWTIESSNYISPRTNNIYYQENIDDQDDRTYDNTRHFKSASRPIHRSQQEVDLLRQEEKMISAVEHEYEMATWRMYNRIKKHRQRRPLPDRYYDEIANHKVPSTEDVPPSDVTATTTGTNSTSSSPSQSSVHSPKFAAVPHSKSRRQQPPCVHHHPDDDDTDRTWNNGQFCGGGGPNGLPRTVVSQPETITLDEEIESEDEYVDMMMFDLEL